MSTHVVVLAKPNISEPEATAAYAAAVQPLLAAAGVKVLFRGQVTATLAGNDPPTTILVLEFIDSIAATNFFEQEAYRSLVALRDKGFERMDIFQTE